MDSQIIVNTMEVLDTKPINELVSEAIIKVCYVQDEPNQNQTVITREVGKEIAATLPGAPVAGFFNKELGDFEEHTYTAKISGGIVEIEDLTKPYGFVSPTDKPWYQDFLEDGVVRTYLLCKAYFWTRQYAEASLALGKGQSMELNEDSIRGYYKGPVFIFTSVTLDKLCILGNNYAPCFEGANITANYSKQYEGFAEQLEKIIGRRYYVMNGKLNEKPNPISLKYAVELGWNLNDAVYTQLSARGADNRYYVVGIFSENGAIFVILQDRETLEYVKCGVVITAQDTVELAAEMQAVTQTWVPKTPAEPQPIESLSGGEAVSPEKDIPMNVAATYSKTDQTTEGVSTVENTSSKESQSGTVTPPPVTYGAPTDMSTIKTEAPAPVPASAPAESIANTFSASTQQQNNDAKNIGIATIDAQYSAQLAQKEQENLLLKQQIANYKKEQELYEKTKKDEIVKYYSTLLTKEEIDPIAVDLAKYSAYDVEAKLAIAYARKQQQQVQNPKLQVNLQGTQFSADVPEFIKEAQEYDKARELRLV